MQKECKICGAFFDTDRSNRIYCDDCSKHYTQRKREYTNAYAASKRRMYEPEVIEEECEQCGKKFKTIHKLLITYKSHKFCSNKCMNDYIQERAVCSVCGKSMKGNPRFNADNTVGAQYCSDECEQKGRYEIAKRNGWVHVCAHCGKEFIRQTGIFCSQECHRAALKAGWRPEKKPVVKRKEIRKNDVVMRNQRCAICGNTVLTECKISEIDPDKMFICSDRCQGAYDRWLARKKGA